MTTRRQKRLYWSIGMSKELTEKQVELITQVIYNQKLYDGDIPYSDQKALKELAQQFVDFALSAKRDGSEHPATQQIIDIVEGTTIENIISVYEDPNNTPEDAPEDYALAPNPGLHTWEDDGGVASPPIPDTSALNNLGIDTFYPENYVPPKATWLKDLTDVSNKMNLPRPEPLDFENEVPTMPRDISKTPIATQHKLYGQFNSAYGAATDLAIDARADANNYKMLRGRMFNTLVKEYRAAGDNKTTAKENAIADSRYTELDEIYHQQDAKRAYFDSLAEVYKSNVDVLSRSLTYFQMAGK